VRRIALAAFAGALAAAPVEAIHLDRDETLQLLARAYSQAAIRTVDSFGQTFPETDAGDLIQHRNLIELELAQSLDEWWVARPHWVSDLGIRLRYKGVYEGVYDYGPDEFSELVEVDPPSPFAPGTPPTARTVNRTAVNRQILGSQHELWNAYVQGSAGPLFLRLGRQDLSWGETDGFRLLDMIQPLDGRFGFPLVEDLDDRRIPLRMIRATLALPSPADGLSNLALDSFVVPGGWDDQEAPLAPRGSPFAVPSPASFLGRVVSRPDSTRGGGRLLATLGDRITVSLAHYATWNDSPATRLRVLGVDFVDGRPVPEAALDFVFYRQQVTGGSLTSQLTALDAVVRAEAAMFWNERVFDPARAGLGPNFQSTIAAAIADRAAGGDGESFGGYTPKDVFRWVVGVDRFLWIHALNPTNVFNLSMQLFHTRILDHEDSIVNGIQKPGTMDFVSREQDEFTTTFLGSTLFWHGRLSPSVFAAYDPRGVVAIVPGMTWLIGTHVRATVKYAYIDGRFVNLGFFRDRDELLLRLEVSL
jgi:hypothetical protein